MTVRATRVDAQAIASLDRTLHEPVRLGVVACLYVVDEADFIFLQSQTGITGGNLSSHLKRLADEGYIVVRKEFEGARPHTTLSLTADGRARFETYLETIDGMLGALRKK
ncbi:MAG TPA: transcriptional regulator [Candidatus Saccharimonadales bacterium]|nr:transcriptional regulator [Candidatus Saccharimonadales bacterium]